MAAPSRGSALLACGAALGIALAVSGLGGRRAAGSGDLPAEAVALVNGRAIGRADYERALMGAASDRRDGEASPALSRRILDRLVDEELLVQRGVELGLVERDLRLRTYLAAAVVDTVVAAGDAEPAPTDDQLRDFYDEEADYFRRPPLLHVAQLFFAIAESGGDAAALERAAAARARLDAGESFDAVRTAADVPAVDPPAGAIPASKLADYVGPTVAQAALDLAVGEVGGPLRSGAGYHLVRVVAREAGARPPFAEVREAVRAEYRRRADERRLRAFLDGQRARADVRAAGALP